MIDHQAAARLGMPLTFYVAKAAMFRYGIYSQIRPITGSLSAQERMLTNIECIHPQFQHPSSKSNDAVNESGPMSTLTNKDQRTLLFATKRLFSAKALVTPKSIRDIPPKQFLTRELRLAGNRIVFLSDSGYEHFRSVVNILDRVDYFNGEAGFSDIWSAWRTAAGNWLSHGLAPENANEVIQSIADLIVDTIDDHTFAVPLFGIELDGIDSFDVGSMTILRLSVGTLDAAGVAHDHADISQVLESNKNLLWLRGIARGTPRVAQQRFSEQATLMVGMLAVAAGAMYERGAIAFRIGTVMTPEDAIGRSTWFSWRERDRSLTTHYASPRGQPFPVNQALGNESDMVRMIFRAFAMLQAKDRTNLEEAISRAVYWYSDAHRDPVLVMKLVKYWSCVEAFFSIEKEEITQAVSAGLASLLVFGGFHFVPPSEYRTLKQQIVDLYKLRSRAVHRGSHQHTTEQDVAQFSQWVAWMIISMVALAEQGYTTLKELKEQIDRLDAQSAGRGI